MSQGSGGVKTAAIKQSLTLASRAEPDQMVKIPRRSERSQGQLQAPIISQRGRSLTLEFLPEGKKKPSRIIAAENIMGVRQGVHILVQTQVSFNEDILGFFREVLYFKIRVTFFFILRFCKIKHENHFKDVIQFP